MKDFICRWEEFCCKPVHVAANLIDPRFKGSNGSDVTALTGLLNNQTHLALDIGKVLSNVAEYRTSSDSWSRSAVWEFAKRIAPTTRWQDFCTTQPLTSHLLRIPPLSAAFERNWSIFGNMHTKSRNRLTCERVQKLASFGKSSVC